MYRKPPGMIAGAGPSSGNASRKPMKGDACKPAPSNLGMGPGTTSEPKQESLLEMGLSLGLGLGLYLKARSLMPILRPTGFRGNGLLERPELHKPFQKSPQNLVHFFFKIDNNTLPSPKISEESFPFRRYSPKAKFMLLKAQCFPI